MEETKTAKEIVQDTLGSKVVFSMGGGMILMPNEEFNANEIVGMMEEYARPLLSRIKELEKSPPLSDYPFLTEEKMKAILSFDNAWPLQNVLEKLTEATQHLLHVMNYDKLGWEEVSHCVKRAREILSNFEPQAKKMEIIRVGYLKDVEIGDSYLQSSVVNMWDSVKPDEFVYYEKGYRFTLEEWTRKSKTIHTVKKLLKSEVSDEMKDTLLDMGFTFS